MSFSPDKYIDALLGLIASASAERGCRLTTTRLVKFLYLFDLFWAQSEKSTFTGWPWAFVHYGPYCRESMEAIDRAEKFGYLASGQYESKYGDKDYRLYTVGDRLPEHEVEEVKSMLPIYVFSNLMRDVQRWCDDTYGLLNYVYFHTGPMQRAMPGESLSFAEEEKIDFRQFQPVKLEVLSNAKRRSIREAIGRMKLEAANAAAPVALYDKVYTESLGAMDEEDTPTGASGEAAIQAGRRAND